MASAKIMIAPFLLCLAVAGCGGSGGGASDESGSSSTAGSSSSQEVATQESSGEDFLDDASSPPDEPTNDDSSSSGSEPVGQRRVQWPESGIVSFRAVSQSNQDQTGVPITIGQVFERGAVARKQTLSASIDGRTIPIQVDKKATWDDGSLRHAVISVRVPTLEAGARPFVTLRAVERPAGNNPVTLHQLLATDFNAKVSLNINGTVHTVSARQLLAKASQRNSCSPWGRQCKEWLAGPLVSAWLVGGPTGHPNLQVYFYVRAYRNAGGAITHVRVDAVIENTWTYKAAPQNVTYDAAITTGEQSYRVSDLTHYDHARWHKVLWWRDEPAVYARLNGEYIQATGAVSNYADVTPTAEFLRGVDTDVPPMTNGAQTAHMGNAGAQPAIGPLPRWTSTYIVSTGPRAFAWMLQNDDAAGSYSFHFRDAATGRPLSIVKYPYVTIAALGFAGQTSKENWTRDLLPRCPNRSYPTAAACSTPYDFDISHHPSIGYVSYMVTGNYYYLEEMQFTASFVELWMNAKYRDFEKGHLVGQIRGQAWALRSISDAAFITPDDDPLKDYYNQLMANILDDYNRRLTQSSDAEYPLHVLTSYTVYPLNGEEDVGIAPWQQDFFTWAVGHVAEQGFEAAEPFLQWLAEFQVGRMTDWKYSDSGFCWLQAAVYKLQIKDTESAPVYSSLNRAYMATYPEIYALPCNSQQMLDAWGNGNNQFGEMSGYPYSPTGFPSNFQIGLAMAADSGIPHAEEAWEIFANRSVQPDYSNYPNFAVVPRD